MSSHDINPDPALSAEQLEIANALSPSEIQAIDEALIACVSVEWRKVSRVVGTTMMESVSNIPGLPDLFFAQRVRELVTSGRLEFQGNLENMRYSEIRLP